MENPSFVKQFITKPEQYESAGYPEPTEEKFTTAEIIMLIGMAFFAGFAMFGFYQAMRLLVRNL